MLVLVVLCQAGLLTFSLLTAHLQQDWLAVTQLSLTTILALAVTALRGGLDYQVKIKCSLISRRIVVICRL